MNMFKIGDYVKIIHRGYIYPNHADMAQTLGLNNWAEDARIKTDTEYVVVATNITTHTIFIGIEDREGKQYIIGSQGLELSENQPRTNNMTFKKGDKVQFISEYNNPDSKMPGNVYEIGCVHTSSEGIPYYYLTRKSLEGRTVTDTGSPCSTHGTTWNTRKDAIKQALSKEELAKQEKERTELIKESNITYNRALKIVELLSEGTLNQYETTVRNTIFSRYVKNTIVKTIEDYEKKETGKEEIAAIKRGLEVREKILKTKIKELKSIADELGLIPITKKEYNEGYTILKTKEYLIYDKPKKIGTDKTLTILATIPEIFNASQMSWRGTTLWNRGLYAYPTLRIGKENIDEWKKEFEMIRKATTLDTITPKEYAKKKAEDKVISIKNNMKYKESDIKTYQMRIKDKEKEIERDKKILEEEQNKGYSEKLEKNLEGLKKLQKIEDIIIQPNVIKLKTKPVVIKDTENEDEQYTYLIGEFIIEYTLDNEGKINGTKIYNIKNTHRSGRSSYEHPHISGPSSICLGNIEDTVRKLKQEGDVKSLTLVLLDFLWAYNRSGQYEDIAYWKKLN